jgi:phosphonate transport system substrate-binding protein
MVTRGANLRSIIFCLLLSLSLLLIVGCNNQENLPYIELSEAGHPSNLEPGEPTRLPLRVAVAAVISPRATLESYQPMMNYLSNRLDRPVELIQRGTYAETNDLVRSGEVDLAFVCGGAFVEGERDFGMELLVAPRVKDQTVYYSYIIVPSDSSAQIIEDLRGKTFAFSDPLSNSGHLAPIWRLSQIGETEDTFFNKTIFTYSHDNSIQAVADRLVDGAAVDSLVYDYLHDQGSPLADRVQIIERLGPYGIPPVVVHPDIDPELRTTLRTILLDMHQDSQGEETLNRLNIDRFVELDLHAYDSLREMAGSMRGWDELP